MRSSIDFFLHAVLTRPFSTEIRSFETELAQVRSGKQHVQARIDEYAAEKQEHMAAIANANRMLNVRERRTHSEVRRLQGKLSVLAV